MIDSHTHLNYENFREDLDLCLNRMKNAGVEMAIAIGSDVNSSKEVIALADKYSQLFCAVGVHPSEIESNFNIGQIKNLLLSEKIVGIGEVGLDYTCEIDRSKQKEVFSQFIELSLTTNLPLIIHCREAMGDLIQIFEEHQNKVKGVVHCFTGTLEEALTLIELGLHISFTNLITYPKNENIRAIIKNLPEDKILIETDCPFLPPQAKRGHRCEPADVIFVAETIGQILEKDVKYIDQVTTENTKRLFKIKI